MLFDYRKLLEKTEINVLLPIYRKLWSTVMDWPSYGNGYPYYGMKKWPFAFIAFNALADSVHVLIEYGRKWRF